MKNAWEVARGSTHGIVRGDAAGTAVPTASLIEGRVTEIRTSSVAETEELGRRIGAGLSGGKLIVLTGPLGAGKTAFVRGVAAGAGSVAMVSSPTFVLEHHYAGRLALLHVDLYRLATVDVVDLAIDDVLAAGGAVLVEWGERLPDEYLAQATHVTIELDKSSDDARIIHVVEPRE